MYLPDSIARCVSALPYEESGIGMSGSKVLCYENMGILVYLDELLYTLRKIHYTKQGMFPNIKSPK